MPLSEQAASFRQMLLDARAVVAGTPTIQEMRDMFEGFGQLAAPLPDDTKVTQVKVGGVPALEIVAPDTGRTVMLYLHGGGFVMGSAQLHSRTVGHLAGRIKARALVLDYRLAPEHPHPAQVDDCTAAYEALLDQGISPGDIVITGESAGGNLVISTLLNIKAKGLAFPAAAVAMSPWLDPELTGESIEANKDREFGATVEGLTGFAAMWLGDKGNRKDPLVNPLFGDLTGLPPLYIQVGTEEMLLSDSERLARQAEKAGLRVELDIVPEMQHIFQLWAGSMPEADAALDRIAAFLQTILKD